MLITYENRQGSPVYLGTCGHDPPLFHLEKRIRGEWVDVYRPACPAVLVVDPFEVEPGGTYRDTIQIAVPRAPGTAPTFDAAELAGTYRLVFEIYSTWNPDTGNGTPLADAERQSNPFEVTQP